MKKGPFFSWLLRCTLTYFWGQRTMKVTGVDCGGGGGGKSQLPLVCVGGVHSLMGEGAGKSCQAPAGTILQP